MSISARFKRRRSFGIAALIAAIGSSVMLTTSRPHFCMVMYRLSTTSRGRKVAMTSAFKVLPL